MTESLPHWEFVRAAAAKEVQAEASGGSAVYVGRFPTGITCAPEAMNPVDRISFWGFPNCMPEESLCCGRALARIVNSYHKIVITEISSLP